MFSQLPIGQLEGVSSLSTMTVQLDLASYYVAIYVVDVFHDLVAVYQMSGIIKAFFYAGCVIWLENLSKHCDQGSLNWVLLNKTFCASRLLVSVMI
jgi:hypothetical protein